MTRRPVRAAGFALVAALVAAGVAPLAAPREAVVPGARADDGTAPFDVDSEPGGARVLLDGKEIGRTPILGAPVAAGRHTVRVEAPEHEAFETTFEVSAGGRARVPTVKLVPWPRLAADARAADATFTVDGAAVPPSGRVAPGPHVVVFSRPGFAPQTHRVEVASGRDAAVEAARWDAFQARLDLTALPKDVVAEFGGAKAAGVLTWAEPTKGVLRLTRPGHFPREIAVDLALGATFAPADEWTKLPAVAASRAKGLGDAKADGAVKAALGWLTRHQSDDGRWDCDGFVDRCAGARCRGAGEPVFDVGVTGLATLAFVGAGRTHVEGPSAATVARAVRYLTDVQDSEGCYGPRTSRSFQYNHACAASAVLEAWWLTDDPKLRAAASRGVQFTLGSQNPYLAWRYGVRDGDNDTPTTVYQALVLRTAEWTALAPDPDWRPGALAWMDKMTEPAEGQTGYQQRGGDPSRWVGDLGRSTRASQPGPMGSKYDLSEEFPNDESKSLTAGALLVRRLLPAEPGVRDLTEKGVLLVARHPPFRSKDWYDLHYALWGSLLHAQDPKGPLASWRRQAADELVARQWGADGGCLAGSWDDRQDPFGAAGGGVYATAMAVLTLQAPNRFPVVPPPAAKKPARK